MAEQLVPEGCQGLRWSDNVARLQAAHRLLDRRIDVAEHTGTHTQREIKHAKLVRLRIKDRLHELGESTRPNSRPQLEVV